jgi:hypothetical protein
VKKRIFLTLPGLELRSLGHPARSHSLYRLRYPGSHKNSNNNKNRNCNLEEEENDADDDGNNNNNNNNNNNKIK